MWESAFGLFRASAVAGGIRPLTDKPGDLGKEQLALGFRPGVQTEPLDQFQAFDGEKSEHCAARMFGCSQDFLYPLTIDFLDRLTQLLILGQCSA
jgi:hypothetical protein